MDAQLREQAIRSLEKNVEENSRRGEWPVYELYEIVSESVWLRLGQGMARCLNCVASVLRAGADAGVFDVDDPDYTANVFWTQALGIMHLARIKVGVRQAAPGVPALFSISADRAVESCVSGALLLVGARRAE